MNSRQDKLFGYFAAGLITVVVAITIGGCRKQPSAGGTVAQELTVGISTDVDNWYLDRFPGGDARFVWSQVYETLVRLTPDLKIKPGLATSWKSTDEGRTWTFHLRKPVRFHDGTPFNAEAVVFSYGPQSYAVRTILRALERVEAADEHTVKFVLSRPMPLPYYLTHVGWPIMAPDCIDKEGEVVRPIGTGPFRFYRQDNDQQVVLVRNDHYWGSRPRLTRVTFKIIPDATARVMALEAEDVDMIVKVPEAEVARLQAHPDLTVYRRMSTFTDFIQFNCQRPPFSDLHLRQAVAHGAGTQKASPMVDWLDIYP